MQLEIDYRRPKLSDETILKDYIQEHYENNEKNIYASGKLTEMTYGKWLETINGLSRLDSNCWCRSNLYLVFLNDHLIGLINIKYQLNDDFQYIHGEIEYGVRPSARQMGFATEILKYGLEECEKRDLKRVILSCLKDNIAASKTMLRCGGQLIKEKHEWFGLIKQYYQFRLEDEVAEPELWDLYDKNRNLVGKDHIRGVWPIPDDCYHLVVHVWLRNSKGEYLIAQRSAKRKNNPLKWECQGGAVTKGEDSLTSALREVKEEIGIELNSENGRIAFSRLRDVIDGKRFGDIMDVWLFDCDGEASLLGATTDEVAQTRWATIEEIKEMYDRGEFVQTLGYFFEEIANA